MKNWFESSYRRNLVDMHIPDWDERFLSQFDPQAYADAISLSGVDTAYIYASSCLGICYWPTKAGYMHKGIKGRDIFGETVKACRKKGLNIIAYFNIWSKWAYENYPEWRFMNGKGEGTLDYLWDSPGHYGVCCPNTPFKDHVRHQIADLCRNYDFDGMFIDMILWPESPCYCPSCKKRYLEETGKELPRVIDWEDPDWISFQRHREKWLAEFAQMITETAKSEKAGVSVCHQCAAFHLGWKYGYSEDFLAQSDYLAGDFYGNSLTQSVACKLFNSLSNNKPFEFMTSRCPNLFHHTILKTPELLKAEVYSSIANNCAFLFIDAIDPIGTINVEVYKMMGEIFKETSAYEKYLDVSADCVQDVGIYFNCESLISVKKDKGVNVVESSGRNITLYNNVLNISKTLIYSHIPFGVITKKSLKKLDDYRIIVLPDLGMMDEEETEAIRQYVEKGGSIYVSKGSSMMTKEGVRKEDFMLSDVLGVTYLGETREEITYLAPSADGEKFFSYFSAEYPISITSSQMRVRIKGDARTLAFTALPFTDPKDKERFSSAISNPPGRSTKDPGVVLNSYGKGKSIYVAGNLEAGEEEAHRTVFLNLLRALEVKPFSCEAEAPGSVELTLFSHKEKNRLLINLLNCQKELPNIPVYNTKVKVLMEGKKPLKLLKLPEERHIPYSMDEDCLEFTAERLDIFAMYAVEYSE